MNHAYAVRQLQKSYPDFCLGPLDLDLPPGLVQGLVGPNGSGKTTLLLCMMGMATVDRGEVLFSGQPAHRNTADWKRDLGFVPDEPAFFEGWSGARNLKFISQFYPDWSPDRAAELARRFQLPLNKKAWSLSRGNRTKLALVAAMAHRPRLYLFDEPTAGLDPVVRSEVMEALWEEMEGGERSIIYSTHLITDLQRFADELVFLRDGRVQLRTDKESLADRWGRLTFQAAQEPAGLTAAVEIRRQNGGYQVISADAQATLKDLAGRGIQAVQHSRLSMEDIAVSIMKGGTGVAAD
ncbi:MAG: ABC transporter ATP-binding protein [Candidatus Zixiibacteriota bacterium]|nr:MAG: ABC transporter ATP-binding protein [candidate division Zixibacteria bacterium]